MTCRQTILALALCGSAVAPAHADLNLMVVRVGDGSAALTNASTPVFLEERASDGTLLTTTPMPIVASGANHPVTLSGSASSEGALVLSEDGAYVTMAGYAVAPGLAGVATSSSASVSRVVARVDALETIDSSTRFLTAFSGNNVRSAVTDDGTRFWAGGNGSGSNAGVQYILLGAFGGAQIQGTPATVRVVSIFNGQLYGSAASGTFTNVFTVGSGLPTTSGQTATSLPGFPTANASPFGYSLNAAANVCYVADDRAISNGGGVEKWVFDESTFTWTRVSIFNDGLTTGVRGLAVDYSGATPRIYATTTELSANKVVRFDDAGSPTASIVATAPTNTVFRGVAIAPGQSLVSVEASSPDAIRLAVAPNPCPGKARVEYTTPRRGRVSVSVYDPQGRRIETLLQGEHPVGRFSVPFDLGARPAGIYLLRMSGDGFLRTTKVLKIS